MITINSKGVTLAELLLAASILIFVICGCLAFFVNCTFLNESNRNLTSAMTHAQYVMEELRNERNLENIQTMIDDSLFTTFEVLPNENITVCQWTPPGGFPDPGGGDPPGCEGGVCPPGGDPGGGESVPGDPSGPEEPGEPSWQCVCNTPPCDSCVTTADTESDPLGVCIKVDWRDRGVRDRNVELLTAMTNYSLTPETSADEGTEVSDEPEEGPPEEPVPGDDELPSIPPPEPPNGDDDLGGCSGGVCE